MKNASQHGRHHFSVSVERAMGSGRGWSFVFYDRAVARLISQSPCRWRDHACCVHDVEKYHGFASVYTPAPASNVSSGQGCGCGPVQTRCISVCLCT